MCGCARDSCADNICPKITNAHTKTTQFHQWLRADLSTIPLPRLPLSSPTRNSSHLRMEKARQAGDRLQEERAMVQARFPRCDFADMRKSTASNTVERVTRKWIAAEDPAATSHSDHGTPLSLQRMLDTASCRVLLTAEG